MNILSINNLALMKVLSIEFDKKNATIYFDESAPLVLSKEVFLKSSLRKGDIIDEKKIRELEKEEKLFKAKQISLKALSKRLLSEYELKQKLKQKNVDDETITAALQKMKELGFINDEKFAILYSEYLLTSKKSVKEIKFSLKRKGIDDEIICEIIEKMNYSNADSKTALQLAQKKIKSLSAKNYKTKDLKQKLYLFLLSKGYDSEVINLVIKETLKDSHDEITNE